MKRLILMLALASFLLMPAYTLAGECCTKQKCVCAQKTCCTNGATNGDNKGCCTMAECKCS